MADNNGKGQNFLTTFQTVNKVRAATFISSRPLVMGLTIADMYWVLEGIAGAGMAYYAFSSDEIDHWFGGHASTIGVLMVLAAVLRVSNFWEEEINIAASALLLVLAANAGGAKPDIERTIQNGAPSFSYNANVAQPSSGVKAQWFNTEKNIWLEGDPSNPKTQAGWCAKYQAKVCELRERNQ